MWYNRYKEDPTFDPSRFPHIPDIRTENGLKDVMAIGNILELATVLDRRCYVGSGLHWTERLEMGTSREMYRQLQSIISLNYVLSVEGKPIRPSAVFQRSLLEFAAAVVVYKEDMHAARKIPSCSPVKVKEKMLSLFRSNYPELLPKLQSLIHRRAQYLYWTGPTISISRRTKEYCCFRRRKSNTPAMVRNKPLCDFADFLVYDADGHGAPTKDDTLLEEPIQVTMDGDVGKAVQEDNISEQRSESSERGGSQGGAKAAAMEVDDSREVGDQKDSEADADGYQSMDVDSEGGIDISQNGQASKKKGKKVRGKKGSSRGRKKVEKLPPIVEETQIVEPSQKMLPRMEEGQIVGPSDQVAEESLPLAGKGKRPTAPLVTRGKAKRAAETSEELTSIAETSQPSDGKMGKRPAASTMKDKTGHEEGPAPKRARQRK